MTPTLSRNEAQAHTAIAQRAWELPLHCGGTDWLASLRPVIQADWSATADATFACIEWAGAQLQLQLPTATSEQLMSALLDGAALPDIPESMRTAALEAALSELLDALQTLGRGAPQVTAVSSQPPPALPHALAWQLAAPQGAQALDGEMRADSLGLLLMSGMLASRPHRVGPLAHDNLAVHLYLDIGYATLSTEELQRLGLGDVLLMERSFLGAERVLWLQAPDAGGLHVQLPADDAGGTESPADGARAAAPFLTVVQPWTHAMPALDLPLNEAASFDAIPVRLSFDLGEISLTLAELRALQPGQAIRLGHPVTGAVRIRANGALIGAGELVEIDGHLGISVGQLFAGNAKSTP
jgi:type III secretion protein Q